MLLLASQSEKLQEGCLALKLQDDFRRLSELVKTLLELP